MLIDLDYETIALARKYRSSALNHFNQAQSVLAAVAEAADNTVVHDPPPDIFAYDWHKPRCYHGNDFYDCPRTHAGFATAVYAYLGRRDLS